MQGTKLTQYLWAVAAAIVVTWVLTYASISYVNAEHNPTVYHYKYKTCPATNHYGGH